MDGDETWVENVKLWKFFEIGIGKNFLRLELKY